MDEAKHHYEESRQILKKAYGRKPPEVSSLLCNLAEWYRDQVSIALQSELSRRCVGGC